MKATPNEEMAGAVTVNRPRCEHAMPDTAAKSGPVELLCEPYPGDPTREIVLLLATFSPGDSTPPHVHPGILVGYVLAGDLEFQLEGQPMQRLTAGDRFYEPPHSAHVVSRNPGQSTAQVLAFIIRKRGAPVMIPLDSSRTSA